ncbi:MAG: DUF6662 family protein [Bacteriovoracaceae bacterium]|nr:hypothetical protein [Bacteroidota bacterium]
MLRHVNVPILFFAVLMIIPEFAVSNERRFGYAYESSVLPPGAREIEIWNTDRRGRTYFYRRMDQRIEYEFGVSNNLMSAFYLNTTTRTRDSNGENAGGSKSSSTSFAISNEWKYKLMDRVADPFGLALYGEGTMGTDKFEIEAKIIADKQLQNLLIAFDLVGEYESSSDVVNGSEVIAEEYKVKADAGAAFFFSNSFGTGIELRTENIFVGGSLQHSAIFAGPTVSYASEEIWATLTFLPQIYGPKGGTTVSKNLNFDEFEKIQIRLLLSFHF